MKSRGHKRFQGLRLVPWITLALFLAPVLAGLAATALPAFGYLPALGGEHFNLSSWQRLVEVPGLTRAAGLSLWTGVLATLLTVILVFGFCSAMHDTPLFRKSQIILSPLLATPHVALAIGLAFLITPSGWLVRLFSPWLTGWARPPDIAMVQDNLGLALVLGLLIKEVPFILLMTLSALNQVPTRETLLTARSLGYSPMAAWLKVVLPRIYPQIRLPVYAVLAFSMSVVDVAVVLAPTTPPPLSVMVFRMFMDRDLTMIFPAAAGACLQFLLVAAAIGAWRLGEILLARGARPWMVRGHRKRSGPPLYYAWGGLVIGLVALSVVGTLALGLWSFAHTWFYPLALPSSWTLSHWLRHLPDLAGPALTTLFLGLGATSLALILALGCLQNERVNGVGPASRMLWLLYLPLLVPQIAFLFGAQMLLVRLDFDGTWPALIWAHLLFVFPYVFLALADPWRAYDPRYRNTALALTGSRLRTFFRVELPMMLKPVLFAFAIGFAVSVGQYLSTIFAGGGRFTTLTVEAVTLATGNDRRIIGIYALTQAILPLFVYGMAIVLPAFLQRRQERRNR